MKKIFLISAALCLVASIFSCSSDDSGDSTTIPTQTEVVSTVTSGTWRITNYVDSGNNETNDFAGYNFTFNSNNVLMATNGTNEYIGSWSVTNDSSNDDSPSNDLDFNIGFSGPVKFAELTDDWDIVSRTSTKLVLIDVSGGNGGTDNLTFEKN